MKNDSEGRTDQTSRFPYQLNAQKPGGLTLYSIQYRSEVEISGSSEIVVAGSCLQRRASSAGVTQSSDGWGRLSLSYCHQASILPRAFSRLLRCFFRWKLKPVKLVHDALLDLGYKC